MGDKPVSHKWANTEDAEQNTWIYKVQQESYETETK
jgi:hypothetical protein